jgi:hypothetical protein
MEQTMRNKLSIAFTLVAFYALLLPTTTLAVVAGRVGPDIFRISTTGYAWSLADGDATVQNQTASGLNTTVFDTLYGTVTVNLPDDLAAGDTISGTVISAPKKPAVPKEPDAKPTPDDDDAGMDQLNGMVVEVAKQKTPSQMHDNDLSPVCAGSEQKPNELTKTVCNKWTLPDGASKIPVELKNKDGKVIGRTEVPIAKKAPSVKEPEFLTPATGQAGKPVSVKGPFDGDFKNTAIKLGDQTAKFLASSPRKVVVESPRSLKGSTDIQVEYKGKTVAKCSYRSVSVKLAADKLSLKKGEQTSLTVTVAGLIGLLSPLPMQLTNQSAGNLLMEGGQAQTVMIDPKEVTGDL